MLQLTVSGHHGAASESDALITSTGGNDHGFGTGYMSSMMSHLKGPV